MPRIRTYETPANLGLNPSETGVSAKLQEARVVGGLYSAAASQEGSVDWGGAVKTAGKVVVDYAERRELSSATAEGAALLANNTKAWNERVKDADPNDPELAQKFRDEVITPSLEKFRDSMWTEAGQAYADKFVASTRQHFFEKTTADMSSLAGEAAAVNVRRSINSLTNMVKGDPTSLDMALGSLNGTVGATVGASPNLKGVTGAKLSKQLQTTGAEAIVKAAVYGAIERDPENGAKLAQDPRYAQYISGDTVKQMESYARQVQRAERAEVRAQAQEKERQAKQDSDKAESAILTKLYDEEKLVSPRDIVRDPALTREAKERMIRLVERELKPEAPAMVSREATMDLLTRMRLPEGDPNKIKSLDPIYDEMTGGRLTRTDFNFLRNEYQQLVTPEGQRFGQASQKFLEAVKPAFANAMGIVNDQRGLDLYQFQMDFQAKVNQYRKEGKDPYTLLDPRSPEYLGDPAIVGRYTGGSMVDRARRNMDSAMRGNPRPIITAPLPGTVPKTAPPPDYPPGAFQVGKDWYVIQRDPAAGKDRTFKIQPKASPTTPPADPNTPPIPR